MTVPKAAASFNLPYEALRRHSSWKIKLFPEDQQRRKILGPIRTVLNKEQENELAASIIAMDNSLYWFSINEMR